MNKEICRSVDSCLPKRHCTRVSAIRLCYLKSSIYYYDLVMGAKVLFYKNNKKNNKKTKNNLRFWHFNFWFRILPLSFKAINGPARLAIISRPQGSLHKRLSPDFGEDISVRSVIHLTGWPSCSRGKFIMITCT